MALLAVAVGFRKASCGDCAMGRNYSMSMRCCFFVSELPDFPSFALVLQEHSWDLLGVAQLRSMSKIKTRRL